VCAVRAGFPAGPPARGRCAGLVDRPREAEADKAGGRGVQRQILAWRRRVRSSLSSPTPAITYGAARVVIDGPVVTATAPFLLLAYFTFPGPGRTEASHTVACDRADAICVRSVTDGKANGASIPRVGG
jgi:hypothetical protein